MPKPRRFSPHHSQFRIGVVFGDRHARSVPQQGINVSPARFRHFAEFNQRTRKRLVRQRSEYVYPFVRGRTSAYHPPAPSLAIRCKGEGET